MSLTREQVDRVAHLARLRLDDTEMERMRSQLSSILDHIEELKAVDIEGVPITAQVTDLTNVARPDVANSQLSPDEALAAAPDRSGNYFRVKAVFETE